MTFFRNMTLSNVNPTPLPYEHVKLYQQPPDKKRPIVLIGPRNVGRYELRDRLTNEEPHLFCVPIAHTSRPMKESEVNGQDYNFVTKDTFEQLKKVNYLFGGADFFYRQIKNPKN